MTHNARRVLELCQTGQTAGSLAKALGWSTSQVMRVVHQLQADDLLEQTNDGVSLQFKAR